MVCGGLGGSTEAQPVVTRFLKWLHVDSGETRKAGMLWAGEKVSVNLHRFGEATKRVLEAHSLLDLTFCLEITIDPYDTIKNYRGE